LTANEVEHAKSYPHVALFIVSEIELKRGLPPIASGGKVGLAKPWRIDDQALEPLAYRYRPAHE
jgi:hypothetical protein